MLARFLIRAGCALFALTALSAPARGDYSVSYAAVSCLKNQALVRFVSASNEDKPVFPPAPVPYEGALSAAPIHDPSRCVLSDGRKISLAQTELADGTIYGAGGLIATNLFTLKIDGVAIYRREPFVLKPGWGEPVAAIIVDGKRLIECRQPELGDRPEEPPIRCSDQSAKLNGLPKDEPVAAPGKLGLIRAAPKYRRFCRSLVKPTQSPWAGYPLEKWPAFKRGRLQTALAAREDDRFAISSSEKGVDFDNDGKLDHPVIIFGDTHYFDGAFWALPPAGASQDASAADSKQLKDDPDKALPVLRVKGVAYLRGRSDLVRRAALCDAHALYQRR